MKRYLLFAYMDYYPQGGAADFQSDHSDVEDAKKEALKLLRKKAKGLKWGIGTYDRYQIYDTKERKIIDTNDRDLIFTGVAQR